MINKSALKRILKEKDMRVSKDALCEIDKILNEFVVDLIDESFEFANHAGRKTIRNADVMLAINE